MDEDTSIQRRLAAILAADIAGYSRLMHENEPATVRDLKAHQSVILPLVGRHRGRIIASELSREHARLGCQKANFTFEDVSAWYGTAVFANGATTFEPEP